MFTFAHHGLAYHVRPVTEKDHPAILEVYRQCEDFLSLGPVAVASMGMVLADLELSRRNNGCYCGIFLDDETMPGILDYIPCGCHGDPSVASLDLLMLARPYRRAGLGRAVVEALEAELRRDPAVRVLLSGVQVNNPLAIRFWLARGFRITSGPIDHPDGTTAYDLRKDLY